MSPTIVEEIFHALVNYVPYVIFILFVFHSNYKCTKKFLLLVVAISSGLQIILLITPHFMNEYSSELLSFSLTLVSLIFYLLVVEVNFFQALFRLLMVNNIANIIVVPAKCIEGLLFPSYALELTHRTYSLCLIIVQIIILFPIALFLNKWYPKEDQFAINSKIWRSLCLVPVIFYVIWYYIFYHVSDVPSLNMALKPANTLFMLFLLCAQMFIYCFVFHFVTTYNKLMLLKEENNQLNIQTLQYQNFQHQVQDIRTMRHDLRHHLTLMCRYADNDKYDELKNYLHHYTEQLADSNTIVYCNILPLNMLLVYYSQLCKESNISMDIKLNIPDSLILSNSEITVLFGNLLENAYDACRTQTTGSKQITLHGLCRQQQIIFTLDNTFDNKILTDSENHFLSTKHEGYGFGTKSSQNVVLKYHGFIDFNINGNLFCVSFMIPSSTYDSAYVTV